MVDCAEEEVVVCLDVTVREGEVIVWNAREERGERKVEGDISFRLLTHFTRNTDMPRTPLLAPSLRSH